MHHQRERDHLLRNSLFEAVRQKMAIRRGLCPMPYGELEFEVRDPNGYVLVFAERFVG